MYKYNSSQTRRDAWEYSRPSVGISRYKLMCILGMWYGRSRIAELLSAATHRAEIEQTAGTEATKCRTFFPMFWWVGQAVYARQYVVCCRQR